MNFQEIKEKLREKRDIIIIVLTVSVLLLLIVIGIRMQKDHGTRQRAEEEAARPPEKVTFAPKKNQTEEGGEPSSKSSTTSYFLRPSPEEMLALIRDMGQAQLPPQNQEYAGVSVMWPCYFFQVQKEEGGRATVLFDVSEDGFGATIVGYIDTTRFPEILLTERGTKVWLAGEIIGVDPTGIGTIHILSDEIRFQEGLMDAVDGTETGIQQSGESVPAQEKPISKSPEGN